MNKKYVVRLADSERGVCQEIIKNHRSETRPGLVGKNREKD